MNLNSLVRRIGIPAVILPLTLAGMWAGASVASADEKPTLPAGLFLKEEPKDAKPVEEIKKTAKVGDAVVMSGRVGGSKQPFVPNRAVFTLMGPGLDACGEGKSDDHCQTPWDYCCETKEDIAAHSATVQITDPKGAPLKAEVKGQEGIKELSTLVIVGKVIRKDGNALVVSATGIYVPKPATGAK